VTLRLPPLNGLRLFEAAARCGGFLGEGPIFTSKKEETYVDQINPYRGHRHCNTRPRLTGVRRGRRRFQ